MGYAYSQFVSAFHEGEGLLKAPKVPEHMPEFAMGVRTLGVEADHFAERRDGAGPVPDQDEEIAEVLVGEEVLGVEADRLPEFGDAASPVP